MNPANIAIVHAEIQEKNNQSIKKPSHLHFDRNYSLQLIFADGFQQNFDLRSGVAEKSRFHVYRETEKSVSNTPESKTTNEEVTCAISEHIGSESGCVNGVKFSNSRVTALARLGKLGVLAGFRDGTLILITPDFKISQVFSGTDCKQILSIKVESQTDFMCLTSDGSLRHYTANMSLTQESSVQNM